MTTPLGNVDSPQVAEELSQRDLSVTPATTIPTSGPEYFEMTPSSSLGDASSPVVERSGSVKADGLFRVGRRNKKSSRRGLMQNLLPRVPGFPTSPASLASFSTHVASASSSYISAIGSNCETYPSCPEKE